METSLFLARLIGPVMGLMGLFILLHPGRLERAAREILDSAALLLIAGLLAFPAGLAIVLTHNVWSADWRGLITLLGWIAMLAGVARVLLPGQIGALGEAMLRNRAMTAVPGALLAALGVCLCYARYLAAA